MIEVEAPDGVIVEFPDSMPMDRIDLEMRKLYAPDTIPTAEPEPEPQPKLGPMDQVYQQLGEYSQSGADIEGIDWVRRDLPPIHRLAAALKSEKERLPGKPSIDFGRWMFERLPFSGFGTAALSRRTKKAVDQFLAGNPSPDDLMILAGEIRQNQARSERSFGGDVLDVVTSLPKYGAEFAATGGAAAAGRAAAAGGLLSKLGPRAGAAAEFAGGAVGRAAALPSAVAESAERRRLYDGDKAVPAYAKGFYDTAVEAASETLGDSLPKWKIRGAIKKMLGKEVEEIADPVRKTTLQKMIKRGGYDGVLNELLEERFGDVARRPIDGDFGTVGDVLSMDPERVVEGLRQIAVESVAFAFPGAAGAASAYVEDRAERQRVEAEQLVEKVVAEQEPPMGPSTFEPPPDRQSPPAEEPEVPDPPAEPTKQKRANLNRKDVTAADIFEAKPDIAAQLLEADKRKGGQRLSRSEFADIIGIDRQFATSTLINETMERARESTDTSDIEDADTSFDFGDDIAPAEAEDVKPETQEPPAKPPTQKEIDREKRSFAKEIVKNRNEEISAWNDSLESLAGHFGTSALGMRNRMRSRKVREGDVDSVKRFDEMVDIAKRDYPELLSLDENPEESLRLAFEQGRKRRLKPSDKEILDEVEQVFSEQQTVPAAEESDDFFHPAPVMGSPSRPSAKPAKAKQAKSESPKAKEPAKEKIPNQHQMPMSMDHPGRRKVRRPSDILRDLEKMATHYGSNAKIRHGHLKMRGTLGFYAPKWDFIQALFGNDIETAAHEIAHAIDHFTVAGEKTGKAAEKEWRKVLTPEQVTELEQLGKALYGSRTPAAGYIREGFAEYVKFYLTNPKKASSKAPKFHSFFKSEFIDKNPKGAKILARLQSDITAFRDAGSQNRARAMMVDPSSFRERVGRWWKTIMSAFSEEQHFNSFAGLRRFVKAAEQRSGKPIPTHKDPYAIAEALNMTSAARVKYMAQDGMIDAAGNATGAPALHAIEEFVKEKDRGNFGLYLWARITMANYGKPTQKKGESNQAFADRKFRLMSAGKKRATGLPLKDAEQIFKELHSKEFDEAANILYQWNDGVLDYVEEMAPSLSGSVDRIRTNGTGEYIPLMRYFSELSQLYGGGKGSALRGGLMPRRKGSDREIKDPFPYLVSGAARMIELSHQRAVVDAVIRLGGSVENMGDFFRRVPRDTEVKLQTSNRRLLNEIRDSVILVDKDGNDIPPMISDLIDLDVEPEEMVTLFGLKETYRGYEPIISVRDTRTNEWNWFYLDEGVYQSLQQDPLIAQGSTAWSLFVRSLMKSNKLFKAGVVGWRASFQLVTNPIRDLQVFLMNTRSDKSYVYNLGLWLGTYSEMMAYGVRQVATRGKAKRPESLDQFVRLGGEMTLPLGEDYDYTRRVANNTFGQHGIRVTRPVESWQNIWDFVRDIIQLPEATSRIAEMKIVGEQIGWKPGSPMTQSQAIEILRAAKHVTVDFTAAGRFARMMNQFIPFYNVIFQSPRSAVRAFSRNPLQFATRLSTFMMLGIAAWMKYRDEEWWEELDENVRFNYMPFEFTDPFTGRPELAMLPVDQLYGAAYNGVVIGLMDTWYRDDPESFKDSLDVFIRNHTPGLPPIIEEAGEQAMNKDFYFKSPIVYPSRLLKAPKAQQYNDYTTSAAKSIGRVLKISPARIEHAIRGVAGPAPVDLLRLLDPKGNRGDDEWSVHDLPLIKRLFKFGGPLGSRPRTIQEVYDLQEAATTKSLDKESPETAEQRQIRLMLTDATSGISDILAIRRIVKTEDQRRELTREALELARQAKAEFEKEGAPLRGKIQESRRRAQFRRQQAERTAGDES